MSAGPEMSADPKILSHKMARHQKRKNRKYPAPRLDLLPVELQLAILQNMSSCEDLNALVASSPTIHAVYYQYKKTILAHVIQATLGDAFIEACMLQHWRSNNDTYRKETWEHNKAQKGHTGIALPLSEQPYRHIQLKFLHDWYEHTTASAEDQIQNMKHLLTADDFESIKTFYIITVEPLSRLFIEEPAPVHNFTAVYVDLDPEPDRLEPWNVTVTEWQRIMRTLYRYEICCRVYGPELESNVFWLIGMEKTHREMMKRDFFGMFDPSENEEFSFVYTQLASELHKSLHLVQGNTEWRRSQGDRFLYGHTITPYIYNYYYHPRRGVPHGLGGVTAGLLAMGLGLLSILRSTDSADEVANILMAQNPPSLGGFMWETLVSLREAYHFSDGGESAFPESWCDEFWE